MPNEEEISQEEISNAEPTEEGTEQPTEGATGEGSGTKETQEEGKEGSAKPQSRAENAKFAEQRRKAEASKAQKKKDEEDAKRLKDARVAGKIEGLGGKNPYTDEPITNEYELHLYELMKDLDGKGQDPLKGLSKALAEENKAKLAEQAKADEEARKAVDEANAKRNRFVGEISDLRKAYPDLTNEQIEEVIKSDLFKEKSDRWTMIEIYEGLNPKSPSAKAPSQKRNTPSGTAGGTAVRKSFKDMTDEEFLKYKESHRW